VLLPHALQKLLIFSIACWLVRGVGVIMACLFKNNSAKPESTPVFSVPAIGCAGTKFCMISGVKCLSANWIVGSFNEPASVMMQSLPPSAGAIS
jgi:hypothetical protein